MIRHAEPGRDAGACAAIYAPHVADAATSFEERPPAPEDFAERIERLSATHPWLVAERDGVVVGFAYATSHRARAAYRWSVETSVYVADAHARRGVGRALYVELLELLRRQRLHLALAGITLPNPASVALHEALGFEPVGVYREVGYKAGAWRDVGWWQLVLDRADGPPLEPLPPQRLDGS
ncbi:MAG TPA: arsinothricin resistance N-acetyltransferase ArsN1 family B [Thermoleophilaceae bacterium]|nr:arsinothricin resistance N-acetyltransferase ArsN1 family B [Thermoleophilaceae bacterium]